VVEGGTLVQIPRPSGSIALAAALLMGVGVAVPTNTARANDCLTAPNSPAPQGSHWYYRLDRASQRKCWYVRTAGQAPATLGPATPVHSMPAPTAPKPVADDVPMPANPGAITPPSPQVEMQAVKPNTAPVSSATADNTASSIPGLPAPQASPRSQTSAQAAPAAPVAWPDSPPAVGTIKAQEPIAAVLTDVNRGDDSTDNAAGMPMMIFLILALGLALVGMLCRDFMKIAPARRERITAARM